MKISVVLATYNEEKNIKACLNSVRGWCDEIIIVDGSSGDKTAEIAKGFGAKVFITDNPPIFHINKQKAIDLAKSDWILQLDADEQVTEALKAEIDQAIKNNTINGYWLPRRNYFLGKFLTKGGIYPDYTLRLYRRGKGRLPQKDVHEQAEVEGKVGYLKNPLLHYADVSLKRYWQRNNRYTDLLATQFRTKGIKFNPVSLVQYFLFKPVSWFILTYIRHKGFIDGWQGFLFSFFSSLRFPISYWKYIRNSKLDI